MKLLIFLLKSSKELTDMTEMKVYKMLYFLEKEFYKEYNISYINNNFSKLPHGPALKNLKGQENFSDYINLENRGGKVYYSLIKDDLELDLSEEENKVFSYIISKYSLLSASELRTLSHKDAAYLMGENNSHINIDNSKYDEILDDSDEVEESEEIELSFSKEESKEIYQKLLSKYS